MRSFVLLVLLAGVALAAAQLANLGGADIAMIEDEGFNHDIGRGCGPNEHFVECGPHPTCQRSCVNKDEDIICLLKICFIGCICKDGYVQAVPNGPCIPEIMCSKLRP